MELALFAVGRREHAQFVPQRHLAEDGREDRVAVFVMRELVKNGVAGVAARRARVGGQSDDAAAIGEGDALLNTLDAPENVDEVFVGVHPGRATHQLQVLLAGLNELGRLRLRGAEHRPGGVGVFQAIEDRLQAGGVAEADAGRFHGALEAGVIVHPALLVRAKLNDGRKFDFRHEKPPDSRPAAARRPSHAGG